MLSAKFFEEFLNAGISGVVDESAGGGEKLHKLFVGVENFGEGAEVFRMIHFDHGENDDLGVEV